MDFHTRAVPLLVFLEKLFGKTHYARIADSKPNVDSPKFSEAFKDARVRFTHFARAGDDTAASTTAAYAAILRSMAFQCHHNQRAVNIVIPVVLEDGALKENIMTAILISVKDRVTCRTQASVDIDAPKLSFFPPAQDCAGKTSDTRPYISLVMELGTVP